MAKKIIFPKVPLNFLKSLALLDSLMILMATCEVPGRGARSEIFPNKLNTHAYNMSKRLLHISQQVRQRSLVLATPVVPDFNVESCGGNKTKKYNVRDHRLPESPFELNY